MRRRRAAPGPGSCGNRRSPNPTRFTRLMRLLIASVGPFETLASCHATIWWSHRRNVPPRDRTSGGARLIGEIDGEAGHELQRHSGIVDVIYRADDLFLVPCRADLAPRVAGVEEPHELPTTLVVEAFVGLGQQPPVPVERVALVAPVPERLVLDTSTALVELAVGVFDHVERIGDLADVTEGVVVDLAVGARHVQHPPPDRGPPLLGLRADPCADVRRGAGTRRPRPASLAGHDPRHRRPTSPTPGSSTRLDARTMSRPTPTPRPARPGRRQRRGAPRRTRPPRRTPCASHSRARRRPRSPTARTSRPAVSPTAPPDPSTPPAAPRSADRSPSTTPPGTPVPGTATASCATPAGPADRNTADPRTRRPGGPSPPPGTRTPDTTPDPPATRRPPGSGRPQRRRPREQTPPASPQAAHTCA